MTSPNENPPLAVTKESEITQEYPTLEDIVAVTDKERKAEIEKRLAEEKELKVHLENEESFRVQLEQMVESLLVGEETAGDGVTIEEVVNNIFRITVKLSNGQTRVLVIERPIK